MAGVTLWAARRFPRLAAWADERKREIFEAVANLALWAARRFPRLRPLLARVLSDERKREIFEVVFHASPSMRFAVWLLALRERSRSSALECTYRAWWLGVIE